MYAITRADIADMVEDKSCLGKTIELHYSSGPNKQHPVFMTFTGYSTPYGYPNGEINYILHNKNTDKYYDPTAFSFGVEEFCAGMRAPEHECSGVFVSVMEDMTPTWEV